MKYHRGRYVEGKWVFGGICRETEACFLVPVERIDKDTLILIIRAQILPGTYVMSDMWKAYDCLQDEGYNHLTVNHSLNFVDPDTGAHTQRIENTWWGIKRSMPRTGMSKDLFGSYLQEWKPSSWKHNRAYHRSIWCSKDTIKTKLLVPLYVPVYATTADENKNWMKKVSNSTCKGKSKNDNDNEQI